MTALLIARRDMIETLRDVRLFILACLTMGGVIAYCAVSFQLSNFAGPVARDYFKVYATVVFLLAIIPIPPLAAVSITRERHAGTLTQLTAAPVRPRDIVLGKALGATGVYFVLLIMTLPLAGVVFFFTGIDWQQFLQVAALSGMTAFTCAAFGVACSVRYRRTSKTVSVSFFWMLALLGVPQLIVGTLSFGIGLFPAIFLYAVISPVSAIGNSMTTGLSIAFYGAMIHLFFASIVALRYGVRRLRREEYYLDHEVEQQRYDFWVRQLDPESKTSLGNPMLAMTRRLSGSQGTGTAILIIVGSVFLLLSFLHALLSQNIAVAGLQWMQGSMLLFGLVLPALVALEVTREHENGTMDMLRTTLMTPRSVVAGQILNAFYAMRTYVIAALVLFAPLFCIALTRGLVPVAILLAGLVSFALILLAVAIVAQLGALFSRRASVAVAIAYIAVFVLLPGPDIAASILASMSQTGNDNSGAITMAAPLTRSDLLRYPPREPFSGSLLEGVIIRRETGNYSDARRWFSTMLVHNIILIGVMLVLFSVSVFQFQRRHWRDV